MSTLVPLPPPPPDPPVLPSTPIGRAEVDRKLAGVRALAKLLDAAVTIPGTKITVGLDALIGLLPVVGDLTSMLASGYMLTTAAKLGVSKGVLARMLVNIGADAAVGSVPVVGDLLDVAWRANTRNAKLLEQAVHDPASAGRTSWWVVAGMLAGVVAITAAGIALTVVVAGMLLSGPG